MSGIAMLSKVIEKMYIPACSRMQRSVYKEERRPMRILEWILGNHFEMHSVFLSTSIADYGLRLVKYSHKAANSVSVIPRKVDDDIVGPNGLPSGKMPLCNVWINSS